MPTDYRPTVFLPKTDFPMRGDLPKREPPILARWEERLRGGGRKIVSVAEVLGMVDGEIAMQELFAFRQVAVTPEGRAVGYHSATGTRSNFQAHFQSNGVELPTSMFTPANQPPMEQLY